MSTPRPARAVIAIGVAVILLSLGLWAILGANTGWTKSYIEIPKEDEITGIEYTEKVNRFVPGVDLLVPAISAGFVCVFAGMIILKRKSKTHSP
ncbi:MAG: hypothetical protein WEB60_10205 [Terrimicrobiaceae bacterium]